MSSWMKQKGGAPAATLLDSDGKVGKLYGARTTPHMYAVRLHGEVLKQVL